MSAFIRRLTGQLTGNKSYVPYDTLSVIVHNHSAALDLDILSEYVVEVKWAVKISCPEEHYTDMLKNALRQLADEVYGELRLSMLTLERALYERRITDALTIVQEMHKTIREY